MTEKIAVDVQQVADTLRSIVAENPNHMYTLPWGGVPNGIDMCFYVHGYETGNLTTGCIIGHLAHKLGAPLTSMAPYERHSASSLIDGLFSFPHDSTQDVYRLMSFLNNVQAHQDRGDSWGEALRQTDAEAELAVAA